MDYREYEEKILHLTLDYILAEGLDGSCPDVEEKVNQLIKNLLDDGWIKVDAWADQVTLDDPGYNALSKPFSISDHLAHIDDFDSDGEVDPFERLAKACETYLKNYNEYKNETT
jgi:hypothetical protein